MDSNVKQSNKSGMTFTPVSLQFTGTLDLDVRMMCQRKDRQENNQTSRQEKADV